MEEINPPVFYSTSKRYQAQVALSIDESENEVSYSDEDYEVIVTIWQGESESEDGDEDKDVGTILVKKINSKFSQNEEPDDGENGSTSCRLSRMIGKFITVDIICNSECFFF